jgi:hypothetical protein
MSRAQKRYRAAAVLLAIYTAIEATDCIAVILIHLGVIGNPYPQVIWAEFDTLFNQQPLSLLPVFLYFTLLRGLSAVGLFRERMWGFWTAMLVCATTILWVPFLMPMSGLEMLIDGAILFLLLLARFGDQALTEKNKNAGKQ